MAAKVCLIPGLTVYGCERERERSERDRDIERERARPTKSVTSQSRHVSLVFHFLVSFRLVSFSFHFIIYYRFKGISIMAPGRHETQTAYSKPESVSELKLRRKSLFGDHIGRIGWIQMRSFCKSPRSGNYKSLPKLYSINFSCDCVVIGLSATWCGECTERKSKLGCKMKITTIYCYR